MALPIIRRAVLLIGGLVFVVFALVQFNDPDGGLWAGIYGLVALLLVLGLLVRLGRKLVVSVLIAYFLFALVYSFPEGRELVNSLWVGDPAALAQVHDQMWPSESTRELGGLWFCVIALVLLLLFG